MNIAFCYESVLPARGGCEHYISDLARRLCGMAMRCTCTPRAGTHRPCRPPCIIIACRSSAGLVRGARRFGQACEDARGSGDTMSPWGLTRPGG